MVELETVKERIVKEVRLLHPRLVEVSHTIHANPELSFQEHRAATLLADELENNGFAVERGVAGLDTAFVATWGRGKPVVGFLAEYDALRGLGHACGHNLIATWSLGAAVALRHALPDLKGTIKVIGTPAEEGGGGKVIMAEAGVFGGLEMAIIAHPKDAGYLYRGALAVAHYKVEFFGKSAHASSSPQDGINALDAVLQLFFSVNAMRQMMRPTARIHGFITHGGNAPNIIPDYAAAQFLVRAKEQDYLGELERRFQNMVEGAALATGTSSKLSREMAYKTMVQNPPLLAALQTNMDALGIHYEIPASSDAAASTDLGNVSHLVPTAHPYLPICEQGIPTHSPQFALAAVSPQADDAVSTFAILLAWTGADVLLQPELRQQIRASFQELLGCPPQE